MAENVIETFLSNGGGDIRYLDGTQSPVAIIGANQQSISLEGYQPAPNQIGEVREFDDLRGFVAYVNDYKNDATVAFASRERLQVVFDYHKPDAPKWCKHTITFKYRRSGRWNLWERNNNQWMSQEDFADFLDSGLNEITRPVQSDILDIVKNFRATVNADVTSKIGQGGTSFTYRQDTKGGSSKTTEIEVPEYIAVQVAPFEGLQSLNGMIADDKKQIPIYEFRAKCNWKLRGEKPEFKIQLLGFEDAIDETLESVRVAIKELTGVTTYIGG